MSEESDKRRNEEVRVLEDQIRQAAKSKDMPDSDAPLRFCGYKAAARANSEAIRLAGYKCSRQNQSVLGHRLMKNPKIVALIQHYRDGFISDFMMETEAGAEALDRMEKFGTFKSIAANMVEEVIRDDWNIAMGPQAVFSLDKDKETGKMVLTEYDMSTMIPEEHRRVVGYRRLKKQVIIDGELQDEEVYELILQDVGAAKQRLYRALGAEKMMLSMQNESDPNSEQGTTADIVLAKMVAFAARAAASGSD